MRLGRARRWILLLVAALVATTVAAAPAQAVPRRPATDRVVVHTEVVPLNGSHGFQYADPVTGLCVRASGDLTFSYEDDYYFDLGQWILYQVSNIQIIKDTTNPNGVIVSFTKTCGATSGGPVVTSSATLELQVYDQNCASVWSGAASVPWGISIGLTHTCSTVSRANLTDTATGSSTIIYKTVNGLNATLSDSGTSITVDYQLPVKWSIKNGTTTVTSNQPFYGSIYFSCGC